jgi:hypothetical protein
MAPWLHETHEDSFLLKWSFNLILQHRASYFLGSNEYIYIVVTNFPPSHREGIVV